MSVVILYITDRACTLAQRLKGLYPDAKVAKFGPGVIPGLWEESRNLIFIMAAGIVARTIAPLIKDKKTDPAVIVLDEGGRFAVSLLSGHIGGANERAREIASFLGGEAVITTASDVNNMPSVDLWARDNDLVIEEWALVPKIGARFINNGALRVYTDTGIKLPDAFLKTSDPGLADLLVTNKKDAYSAPAACMPGGATQYPASACRVKGQLYLRPRDLVVGIGCNSGTPADEIEGAVRGTLDKHNLSFSSIHSLATIDIKISEQGLAAFAEKYGFEIAAFTSDELNRVKGISKSKVVFKATGAHAVAEPAALLASGNGDLLVPKQKIGNATVAVTKRLGRTKERKGGGMKENDSKKRELKASGKIYVVGTGPGSIEHITPYAQNAIRKADIIIGYDTYLDLIKELLGGKEVFSTGMTREIDRCQKAVELASEGKTVAVISGGDPGIYAMAGLVFELLKDRNALSVKRDELTEKANESLDALRITHYASRPITVEVIPGISALNACAARLGAPLMHDFASISLSDRLTPWELIEKRLEAAARADFVMILYNPKSRGRVEHISRAQEIILKHRSGNTPVGIVKGAMRADERVVISNLKDMLDHDIDMQTAVIIGNSKTFLWNNLMITPRGYENKRQ
ncbi:MAG: bifunctional cobalt-precorrin 5A hydrolase/precorrin-3B C(17)-methyltransferase [Nitrospirae bacterium]|nr:bifunctional cobalt-precorrin 5A hydrolase/precorrin-3B C(17)-methyltransferase [Nitrospirota bacterium]